MDYIKQNKNTVAMILAVIVLVIVFFATKKHKNDVVVNDDVINDPNGSVEGDSTSNTEIPMPEESSWMSNEVSEDKLTLDIPEQYFVSKPKIGDCDVTSISTIRDNGKPVSVAFVYNVGCTHPDLLSNASKSVEKNGYIFRTNYTSPSVIAVFERIVNSAR